MTEVRERRGTSAADRLVVGVVVFVALGMLVAGIWCWVAPASFAAFTNWPNHEHFLHDAGVFQMGIGVMLLAALWWRDVIAVVLVGAVFTNALHALNHALDLDLGGRSSDPWLIGIVALLALVALVVRLRGLRPGERAAR
jgi:predicted anti-sigma-YlaC factor YlaD